MKQPTTRRLLAAILLGGGIILNSSCDRVTGKGIPDTTTGLTWDPTWYGMQAETATNVSSFFDSNGGSQEISLVAYNDISCATNPALPISLPFDPTGILNECAQPKIQFSNQGTCSNGSACSAGYTCPCQDPTPDNAACMKVGGVYKDVCRTRTIWPGASLMGWSVACRDPARCPAGLLDLSSKVGQQFQASITWVSRRLTLPSGGQSLPTSTKTGATSPQTWNLLWGDPAVAHQRNAPWRVFLANLAGTSHPSSGSAKPFLNGACLARSDDGGVNFSLWHCLQGAEPAGGFPGYDGGSIAVDNSGELYAAYWDVPAGRIDVWRSTDVGNGSVSFSTLPTPFKDLASKVVGHPILRLSPVLSNGKSLIFLMAPVLDGQGKLLLATAVWNGSSWGLTTQISNDFAHNAFFGFRFAPDGFPMRIRTAKQYTFDVGLDDSNALEMRYAYTYTENAPFGVCDDGSTCTGSCPNPEHTCRKVTHIQGGRCSTVSLGGGITIACIDVPEWNSLDGTLRTERTDQFNPVIAFARDTNAQNGETHRWRMVYKSRQYNLQAFCPNGSNCSSSLSCDIEGFCQGGTCPDGSPCKGASGNLCSIPSLCSPKSMDDQLTTLTTSLVPEEPFQKNSFVHLPQKVCATRTGFYGDYDGLTGIDGASPGFMTAFTDTTRPNPNAPPPALDVECQRPNNEEANPIHISAKFFNF